MPYNSAASKAEKYRKLHISGKKSRRTGGSSFKAAPHNSARDISERFCLKIKFGKHRNTLCTRKGYAASVGQLTLATAALYFKFFKL